VHENSSESKHLCGLRGNFRGDALCAMTSAISYHRANPEDAVCIGMLATQVFLDTYAPQGMRPDLAREALACYSPEVSGASCRPEKALHAG
jgi:hypothetical protein